MRRWPTIARGWQLWGSPGAPVQAKLERGFRWPTLASDNPDMQVAPPPNMPAEKRQSLDVIIEALQKVPNMVAVVLGGSYASGLARSDSDVDIGLYYRNALPFSVDRVRSVAENICVSGNTPVVTYFYGSGPWVNGGAWIQTPTGK